MAKPPTQLTDLLRRSPDAAAAVRALADAGSLSRQALADLPAVAAAIEAAIAEVAALQPGWCGPDFADRAVDRLAAAGLLSRVGERQRQTRG